MSYSYPKQIEFTIATRKAFLWTLGESSFAASVTKKNPRKLQKEEGRREEIVLNSRPFWYSSFSALLITKNGMPERSAMSSRECSPLERIVGQRELSAAERYTTSGIIE
jgi:hypothetical protein